MATAPSQPTSSFSLPEMTPARLVGLARLVAAGLVGFGVILLVAANWDEIGKLGRFALVGGVIATAGLAALLRPALQAPALVVAFAATGAMLALSGQTYQTGADTWQLFALWAALTLPWAVGARSNAVWAPWVVVAMTALALWHQTFGMHLLSGSELAGSAAVRHLDPPTLAVWAGCIALAAAMSPNALLERLLGGRHWAFRLAVVLALGLVTYDTLTAILAGARPRLAMYAVGLAVLIAAAVVLARARPLDALTAAAATLALDAALIAALVRWIEPRPGASAVSYTLIGLGAALIVAASVVVLMRVIGKALPIVDLRSESSNRTASEGGARPWPVIVLSGIGALMAAAPFMVALVVLLGSAIDRGPAVHVVALSALAATIVGLRRWHGLFLEQIAVVLLAFGLGFLAYGVTRDLPVAAAALLLAVVLLGLAIGIGRGWIGALLGAAATPCLAVAMLDPLPASVLPRGPVGYALAWSLIALAWVAADHAAGSRQPGSWPAWWPTWLERTALPATIAGWGAATLAGLAIGSGQTFLLGATMGLGGAGSPASAGVAPWLARALSLALTLTALWLLRERPELRERLATPMGLVIAMCLAGLAVAMPGLGAVVLMLAVAIATGQRAIAIAAVVSALWIVGAFYYDLSLTLSAKGALLIAAGTLIALATIAAGGGSLAAPSSPTQPSEAAAHGWSPAATRLLAALGLLAVGATSLEAIRSREALIRDGRPVFVELAPVDPRSLMQGDYMALRFALPDGALRHHPARDPAPHAIGRIETSGLVRLTRTGEAGGTLAADEIAIRLVRKGARWILVSDAWFFKEGTGARWEAARYGELRVTPDGRALLVGLADKDMRPIR